MSDLLPILKDAGILGACVLFLHSYNRFLDILLQLQKTVDIIVAGCPHNKANKPKKEDDSDGAT